MMQRLTVICNRINFRLCYGHRRIRKYRISQTIAILLRAGKHPPQKIDQFLSLRLIRLILICQHPSKANYGIGIGITGISYHNQHIRRNVTPSAAALAEFIDGSMSFPEEFCINATGILF